MANSLKSTEVLPVVFYCAHTLFLLSFLESDSISCTITTQSKHFLLVIAHATVSKIYNIYCNSTTGTSIFAGFSRSIKNKKQKVVLAFVAYYVSFEELFQSNIQLFEIFMNFFKALEIVVSE